MNQGRTSQVTRRKFLTSASIGAGALWLAPPILFAQNGNPVTASRNQGAAAKIIVQRAYSVFESRGRQPGHALDHIRSISHGQILNLDLCFVGAHRNQMCNAFVITAKMPSDAIIAEMPVTTARVVASPTAAALAPDCIPRKQPA